MNRFLRITIAAFSLLHVNTWRAYATQEDAPDTSATGAQTQESADSSEGQEHGVLGLPDWLISTDPVPELQPLSENWELFPRGTPFPPLLADPREPRTELALLHLSGQSVGPGDRTDGFAFIGDTFGLLQYTWARRGPADFDGWQFGAQAFANPEVGYSGKLNGDLINVDFVAGPTFTLRKGNFSLRTRLYHESTHLGDELIIDVPSFAAQRVNLSFESAEAILAYSHKFWRVYGGGAYKVHIQPSDIKRGELHFGIECRTEWRVLTIGRLSAGYDMHLFELHDWSPDHSAEMGIELGKDDPTRRNFKILGQYYHGNSPFGQFFLDPKKISYFGFGLRFSL